MLNDVESITLKSRALRLLEDVLITFGASESTQHFTDNPIRMSVWLAFAADPDARRQLLIDLNYLVRADVALGQIRTSFKEYFKKREVSNQPPLNSFGTIVMSSTNMDDMLWAILPQTHWFQALDPKQVAKWRTSVDKASRTRTMGKLREVVTTAPLPALWRFLVSWMAIRKAEASDQTRLAQEDTGAAFDALAPGRWQYIIEVCTYLLSVTSHELSEREETKVHAYITNFLQEILETYGEPLDAMVATQAHLAGKAKEAPIWSIDLNRSAELASMRSRQTLKVDAAENVFSVDTRDICWAVIDSGIDAGHVAFLKDGAAANAPMAQRSRVVATYDFNRLMKLFNSDFETLLPARQTEAAKKLIDPANDNAPQDLPDAILLMLHQLNGDDSEMVSVGDLAKRIRDQKVSERAVDYLGDVRRRLKEGEILDWPLLEPILQVPHDTDNYIDPENGHGTHVAGILGGARLKKDALRKGEPTQDLAGMCPDIGLYDLRVCDAQGRSDEFLVMAALQFIAYLNRTRELPILHGANVSLQIKHDVRNYGCGQTPVCKEANRLVDSGVCVVAAAGNRGFHTVVTDKALADSYAWCSIMDPGNAEKVITVGSTHRISPHTFGVSYFSSRGPTADGRAKPDLVAPGEKIWAAAPKSKLAEDTGTSMSAPHVSGAAAMLMARHPEMQGKPDWIKSVLLSTATDLGRRTEFQGAGLVDVLRALESI